MRLRDSRTIGSELCAQRVCAQRGHDQRGKKDGTLPPICLLKRFLGHRLTSSPSACLPAASCGTSLPRSVVATATRPSSSTSKGKLDVSCFVLALVRIDPADISWSASPSCRIDGSWG